MREYRDGPGWELWAVLGVIALVITLVWRDG